MSDLDRFYTIDKKCIAQQYHQFVSLMPKVTPYYALKCLPDLQVVSLLSELGCGFDCASLEEIKLVLKFTNDIIFANPCKVPSHLAYARDHQVHLMTFDNEDELQKIKLIAPQSQLVLRIRTDDSKSLCKLGLKYGADQGSIPYLLQTAQQLGLQVIGVSFHVGSGCFDPSAFQDALYSAHHCFQIASQMGFHFSLLDIGGGFPGTDDEMTIKAVADTINPLLHLFPNCKFIAEPGRYFVAKAATLYTQIIGRRIISYEEEHQERTDVLNSDPNNYENVQYGDVVNAPSSPNKQPGFMYYVTEGTYSGFNCIYFDHQTVKAKVLTQYHALIAPCPVPLPSVGVLEQMPRQLNSEVAYPCSIWGPTCDSMDCIMKYSELPELVVGDWLYFEDMGAYTLAASSEFNGYRKTTVFYLE